MAENRASGFQTGLFSCLELLDFRSVAGCPDRAARLRAIRDKQPLLDVITRNPECDTARFRQYFVGHHSWQTSCRGDPARRDVWTEW
jgi:hypothetical protein